MDATDWQRQTASTPLFPDMQWSRPENRRHAGKLLIVGGNGYEFRAPANAYGDAFDAGIGSAKVLLPDSMKKVVHDIFPEAEFAPHTPSGSFARTALPQLLEWAAWADGVLLPGDLGRNSETAILLETFLQKYSGQITLARDAAEYCLSSPDSCLQRSETLLVLTMAQLQKLGTAAKLRSAFTFDMDLPRLASALHELTAERPVHLVIKHLDTIFVASSGQVSSTKQDAPLESWRIPVATHAAVWWLQNPVQPFEALTTSLVS